MRYLVTYTETETQTTKVFLTNWFDVQNNFNTDVDMIVYDLTTCQYLDSSLIWKSIEIDHL